MLRGDSDKTLNAIQIMRFEIVAIGLRFKSLASRGSRFEISEVESVSASNVGTSSRIALRIFFLFADAFLSDGQE